MSKKALNYDDYLKSLQIGYDNYKDELNKTGFDFNDEYISKQPRTSGQRNTRKGYAFDDYQNLIDLVGSEKHKDIKMKKAFMSPAAFQIWQNNIHHPSRQKWISEKVDLDGDGKSEFLVRDGKNNLIGINGYYLAQSKYPERFAYTEQAKRNQDGKLIESYDEWKERLMGAPEKLYNKRNLDINYPENFEHSLLYVIMSKYYDVKKKFPAKLRAFKHFSKVIYPTLVQAIKVTLPSYVNELKNIPEELLGDLADCVTYPGNNAVNSARFYSAQCFYAWNVNILQPILHLNKIKAEIEEEKKVIKELIKTDSIFKANHENDDIETLAINRIKSRKWFKDVVDKIYLMLLADQNAFTKLLTEMRDKFFLDYRKYSGNKLLFNEDKLYFFNKKHKKDLGNNKLTKSRYDIVDDDEDANDAFDSIISELSSQVSRETTAESSPVKQNQNQKTDSKKEEKKETPKKHTTIKNIKRPEDIKSVDEELATIVDDDSKSEFEDNDE